MRAIIIGGGVAGPALALFLKKAGIGAAIFEAQASDDRGGGGFAIAPNGMNVLAALDLADAVKARGALVLENCLRTQHGTTLARWDNGSKRYGEPAVALARADLCTILADACRMADITIGYGKRLVAIDEGGPHGPITAHFADGSFTQADILIGADGIHSTTRKLLFADAPKPHYVGMIGIGAFVAAEDVPGFTGRDRQSLNMAFGPHGFFGYCGGGDGRVMWWCNLVRAEQLSTAELQATSDVASLPELRQRYRGYHAPIEALLAQSGPPVKINIHDIASLANWHRGRAILIGDAAHAVSPNAGQGASLALEDAMYLAKLLHELDYARAFATFEHDRRPRVERVVVEGRRRGGDKKVVSPVRSAIRNLILATIFRLFGERSQDWLYRYRIAWNV